MSEAALIRAALIRAALISVTSEPLAHTLAVAWMCVSAYM